MKISIINKTLPYFITFIFLCVPYLINAQDSIFAIGDRYFEHKDYNNAALEYERIIYNSSSDQELNKALFKKVATYKEMNNYSKASTDLERIHLFSLNIEQKENYYYEKILCYYLDGEFEKSSITIEDMYLNIDTCYCSNTLILQVLVYNELSRYEEAKAKADKFIITLENNQDKKIEIDNLYNKIPKQKSEKLGSFLAYFPGLGHFYAGYPVEGIASFVLNASILSFGIYQAFNAHYITAYLGGAGILSGTYFGSYERANLLVRKRNYKRKRAFNDKIKESLLN
ncbi:MAG: hypothetical protein M0O93_01260 [Bacteroidales bacterium]|nr:hypothetical protein [Bacteroidales bacterium]